MILFLDYNQRVISWPQSLLVATPVDQSSSQGVQDTMVGSNQGVQDTIRMYFGPILGEVVR